MQKFKIYNKTTGFYFGKYQGKTESEAKDNFYKDAGYKGTKDAKQQVGINPDDITAYKYD